MTLKEFYSILHEICFSYDNCADCPLQKYECGLVEISIIEATDILEEWLNR